MTRRLMVIASLLVVAGCVDANPDLNGDHEYVERTYRTGSNIPTKSSPQADGIQVMNKDDVDRMRIQSVPQGFCNPMMGCGTPGSH
jgi:hypothetical protein